MDVFKDPCSINNSESVCSLHFGRSIIFLIEYDTETKLAPSSIFDLFLKVSKPALCSNSQVGMTSSTKSVNTSP